MVFLASGQYTLSMRSYAPFRNVVRSNQRHDNLIAENNEIITSKLRELNLSPLDAFQLFSVIDALPKDWRQALKSYGYDRLVSFDLHEQTQLFLSGKEVLLSNADSKGIYKEIRDREIVQPTAQKKYVEFF